ncbi:interleukin-22 receptor subunit alpha-2-like isoform X1 [Astyanax mexicanus]|uniref:Interleukin-22 receptor subunit alpha-2-like isoform X1 n=1 Tax=Astyanax mexicanus TaxID=7994 RepID=A0A8T2LTI0_ASTMX|nr:interleukin-22 receptor subunit alpha-2-like isoform X1 [Astyanax mexicanus]
MFVPATLLLLLCDLVLLSCANSTLPFLDDLAPLKVEFHSLNFRNVLHWRQHPGAPEDLQYVVQYKVYGEKQWSDAKLCQAIHDFQCDLSQETSDPREWYYARVQAVSFKGLSPWIISSRFHPRWDTTFSPPQIRLNLTEQGIVVHIRPPRSPLQGRKQNRIAVTKLQKLIFRIYLIHNGIDKQDTYETDGCSKKVLIKALSPKTAYCLQAVTVTPPFGRTSTRSPSTCITTA